MRNIRSSKKGFTLVEIMIVVAIIGVLVAIAVPGFIRARSQSRLRACQENLTKIEGSKEQFALERSKKSGDAVTWSDLVDATGGSGYLKIEPSEPSGYLYTVGAIATDAVCTSGIDGHSLAEIGDVITTVGG